jgi:hypothetical protein
VCASLSNKPVKLATSVKRPSVAGGHTFMEAENSYNIMHRDYSLHKLTNCVPRNLATVSRPVQCFIYRFSFLAFADLQSSLDSVS